MYFYNVLDQLKLIPKYINFIRLVLLFIKLIAIMKTSMHRMFNATKMKEYI